MFGKTYDCVRVYPNGEFVQEQRDAAGKDQWLEYNKKWRFGQALFVDGDCLYPGLGLGEKKCQEVSRLIKENPRLGARFDTFSPNVRIVTWEEAWDLFQKRVKEPRAQS